MLISLLPADQPHPRVFVMLVKTSKKCINGFTEAIAYEALQVIIGWFE